MNDELTALALSGAQTVVTAMATDVWGDIRRRVAAVLGRGNTDNETGQLERLDAIKAEVVGNQQEPAIVDRSIVRLQDRFYDFLESQPGQVEQFAALISEFASMPQLVNNTNNVYQHVSVSDHGRAYTVGTGSLHIRDDKSSDE